MLIVPIIITIILGVMAKRNSWDNDSLVLGIVVCWATFGSLFLCDMIGELLGWWSSASLV